MNEKGGPCSSHADRFISSPLLRVNPRVIKYVARIAKSHQVYLLLWRGNHRV